MDDETKAFLVAMEARLMARMNDQHERLINAITSLRRDFQNTKGFLIKDSLVRVRKRTRGPGRKQAVDPRWNANRTTPTDHPGVPVVNLVPDVA